LLKIRHELENGSATFRNITLLHIYAEGLIMEAKNNKLISLKFVQSRMCVFQCDLLTLH